MSNKKEKEKLTKRVAFRCTKEEHATLLKLKKETRLKMSDILRARLFDQTYQTHTRAYLEVLKKDMDWIVGQGLFLREQLMMICLLFIKRRKTREEKRALGRLVKGFAAVYKSSEKRAEEMKKTYNFHDFPQFKNQKALEI